ncbi:MAG: helix-turn-helix transcriptional regulator [Clostridia bacterium]|nr:helix-turn-helix transcriptional regulator [Clostridia bacterium]
MALIAETIKQGLTNKSAADAADVHYNSMQAWRTGKIMPDLKNLVKWAEGLGLEIIVRDPKRGSCVELIKALRGIADIGIVNARHDVPVIREAADRLEEMDERIAIMTADDSGANTDFEYRAEIRY